MTSKLARVFEVFRDYLLKSSSQKKKLKLIHERWQTKESASGVKRIYYAWKAKSERRMRLYRGIDQLGNSGEIILRENQKGLLMTAFKEIRVWSKQLAKSQALFKRLEFARRKRLLNRSVTSLLEHSKKCKRWRKAIQLVQAIMRADHLKLEAITKLQGLARIRKMYIIGSSKLVETLKRRSRRTAWISIVSLNEENKRKTEIAENHIAQKESNLTRKSFSTWLALVERKRRATEKGERLAETSSLRLAGRCFKDWSERVFKDKFSLYCRSKTLERCLAQVRAIRAIDHMVQVTQASKERKRQIVAWLTSIDQLMVGKLVKQFIDKAEQTAEFKDNLEYHVEAIQRIFMRLTVREMAEECRKEKLADSIVQEFRKRASKRSFSLG